MEATRVLSKFFAMLSLVILLGTMLHYMFFTPGNALLAAILYYSHLIASSLICTVLAINFKLLSK